MASTSELILVRHASSTRREVGVWGRRFDAPLAAGFEAQLEHSRRYVQGIQDFALLSSPMQRCLQTANYIAPNHPMTVIHELTAYHSGEMEELQEEDVAAKCPGYLELSYSEKFLDPKFGEESLAIQARRVAVGLDKGMRIATAAGTPSVVVVAHYSSINAIGHMAMNSWDTRTYGAGVFDLEDGELLRISIDRSFLMRRLEEFMIHERPDA